MSALANTIVEFDQRGRSGPQFCTSLKRVRGRGLDTRENINFLQTLWFVYTELSEIFVKKNFEPATSCVRNQR